MKKYFYYLLFIYFTSCSFNEKDITGFWKFTEFKNTTNSIEFSQTTFSSDLILSSDGNFLLSDDGILIQSNLSDSLFYTGNNNGSIYYGRWKLNDKDSIINLVVLNYPIKEKLNYRIGFNDGRNVILSSTSKINKVLKYTREDYNDVNNSDYNFTSTELNTWRIKSNHSESDLELKRRLQSAIKYSISYLKYNKQHKIAASTIFLDPLPFVFASNGIALKKSNDNWDNLFFDKDDAEKAMILLTNSFRSTATIPDKYRNKPLDINLFILEEVLKNLDK